MSLRALIVGHISLDRRKNKILLGGPPLYQIPILDIFGYDIDVLTSFNQNSLNTEKLYPKVNFYNKKSQYTTTFQFYKNTNQERGGDDRTLQLIEKANDIYLSDIEQLHNEYEIVIVSPIASELSLEVIIALTKIAKFSFFDIQGLVRNFKENGELYQKLNELEFNQILCNFDVVKSSKSEISDLPNVQNPYKSILIVTDGGQKIDILSNNEVKSTSLDTVEQIKDDTGSGDIFLSTFAALYKKKKLLEAIKFAHEMAKLNLKIVGIPNIDTLKNQKKLLGI
ncbi:MAG: hypothetical protein HeimC2_24010 [Candidatus Heimdallarchaeota archaeon LC_2]|nr:MAG: hypothetical protein HeimC2_24010 [Candidatus Heimdallarchaeota archaeon LC_2]